MKKLLLLILLFSVTAAAQEVKNLELITDKGTKYIPVYVREGTVYFSAKHFAESLPTNFYFSERTNKFEFKFSDYLLKVTARNPYLIITKRNSGNQLVYQLPTSCFVFDNRIYIPAKYSAQPLQIALQKEVRFEEPNKLIIGNPVSTQNELLAGQFDIYDFTIDEKANGTLIRLKSSKRIPSYHSNFKNGILTLTFRKVNGDSLNLSYQGEGLVKKIDLKNKGEDAIVNFHLSKEYTANEVINAEGSNDILITLHNKIFDRNETNQKNKEKWEFDVIVIDAGHGGKDPGAIGMGGVKEKEINLGIALELGKLIEQNMKDVKVVYTRKDDRFIDLYKRGKIANENEGKLFISIHCNSTKQKPTNASGFEVYLLRPGRTQEAIAIAEEENSVIKYEENPGRYKELTDENFILVSMAHSSYMKYSEKFAALLHKEFSGHPNLNSRGVKQAGFYVLVGASMPSVLIESGFLTNNKDVSHLKTKNGQQKFAQLIFNSIKKYREYYELEMSSDI